MAKRSSKVKSPSKEVLRGPSMTATMPEMTKEQAAREKQYQLEDDARNINSFLRLRKDGARYSAAKNFMKQQYNDVSSLDAMPRKATRITARKSRRGSGRR